MSVSADSNDYNDFADCREREFTATLVYVNQKSMRPTVVEYQAAHVTLAMCTNRTAQDAYDRQSIATTADYRSNGPAANRKLRKLRAGSSGTGSFPART